MSIPVLTQVYDETRRLAIAGSVVAGGDFRLKKLLPPLEQAGQKAPVFAKVGEAVKKVVESNEQNSAESLLELSTLVNAILYTQGQTGLDGKLTAIETTDLGQQQTQASARVLKPLFEALTSTGSGRLEIIRDAHERGSFRDLRLVKPALAALDDTYSEIGDLIAEKVLPIYGKAILPELQAKYNLKGKSGDLRRLALMHQLDPETTRPLVKEALENGSKEMKVVAIECLGSDPEDLSFLMEQAQAKAKDVRAAALKALAKSDAGDALAALQKALEGNDLEIAIAPAQSSQNPKLLKFVLAETEKQLETVLAKKEKDKKAAAKQTDRLLSLLECLQGRDDAATEALLLKIFGRREELTAIKTEPSGADVVQRLVGIMASGPAGAQKALVAAHDSLTPENLTEAFVAGRKLLSPAKAFETFSPYLTAKVDEKKKLRDPAFAKREAIADVITDWWRWDDYEGEHDTRRQAYLDSFDPRWLDVAVEQQHMEIVQALARPGHAAVSKLLSKAYAEIAKKKDTHEESLVLRTMVRIQHPEATDTLIASIQKQAKSNVGWGLYWLANLIPDLPKESLPKLEALLATLPEKAIDQLLDHVEALKNKA